MKTKTIKIILLIFSMIVFVGYSLMQNDEKKMIDTSSPVLENSTLASNLILTNNLSIICVSGYSSTVRDVPLSLKKKVAEREGINYYQYHSVVEVDHRIPLCLGGSNDIDNLMIQFNKTFGYKEKDKLENYLCHNVCDGEININYAQDKIYNDWEGYYTEIYGEEIN